MLLFLQCPIQEGHGKEGKKRAEGAFLISKAIPSRITKERVYHMV